MLSDPIVESSESLEGKLKQYFGYNTFRSYQKEIIEALLRREDLLAILPTGAGKSLCYQLPALLLPGTAIVISPLISLMQDQVVSLYKNGIAAAFLNSSLHYQDIQAVLNNISDYKLLYVAPERFADPSFIARLKESQVSFFVIDEAHCISQWGHSFRVEYRKLSVLKEIFPHSPVMAVTATATKDVEKDIQTQLSMKNPTVVKGSFDRPNLTIQVLAKTQTHQQLKVFLKQQKNQTGIIYASTRKGVDSTYEQLRSEGYAVGRYHAGMSDQERSASQHAFLHDQVTLMVATVAFGMGVHKPDIRFIVHMDMPRTIEQYYQEIGRAGRDGLPAECLMLYSTQDLMLYKRFAEDLEDLSIRQQMREKTDKMYRFCTTVDCRRQGLLRYFGEVYPKQNCGSCDNCMEASELIDGTVIAQKILSCVFRVRQNFGMRMVIEILRGSKNQNVLSRGFDQLPTFGLLATSTEQEVRYYIDSLVQLGLLQLTEGEYPVLKWTENSRAVVEGNHPVQFRKKIFKAQKEARERYRGRENASLHYNEEVFEQLRALRGAIAREEQVPAYVVFSDRALQEMAVYFPKTEREFIQINGVGPVKWHKYGEKFLNLLHPYALREASSPLREAVTEPMQRMQSAEETVLLYREGKSLEQIALQRQLAKSTILTHLAESIERGIDLDLSPLVSVERQEEIKKVIEEIGAERLAPIKERLPAEITYDEIRLVGAYYRRR